jgi:mannose-6-phosphate isomerase
MQSVQPVVQHYAWGDATFIPKLLQVEPDGRPWAELWLGTHPNGPARLSDGRLLSELTGELPYLLKVLAAARPLSLQTHPNAEHAREGFERGIYPDANPKPELLLALTRFEALCGVRPIDDTATLLHELDLHAQARVLAADGVAAVVEDLYRGDLDPAPIIEACGHSNRPEATWVTQLAEQYPGEPSVAVTLLLNLVALEPGQTIRLEAGNLHAYLRGAGIELMGNSDNVVRGGLTSKEIDVDELLRVFDPAPLADPVLPASNHYDLPVAGVRLLVLEAGTRRVASGHELALDMNGRTLYAAPGEELVAEATTYVAVPLT